MNTRTLLRLVDGIHLSGLDAEQWPTVLSSISDIVSGSTAALLHLRLDRGVKGNVVKAVRLWPEATALYDTHFSRLDPWAHALRRDGLIDKDFLVTSEELLPFAQYKRTEYYSDFAKKYDIVRNLALGIATRPGIATTLSVLRSERRKPFGAEEVVILRRLQQHFRVALMAHQHLLDAKWRSRIAEEALEHIRTPIVALSFNGRIVFANRAARRLSASADGFLLTIDGVRGANSTETGKLMVAVHGAIRTALGDATISPRIVQLKRPSLKPALIAFVSIVKNGTSIETGTDAGTVLLFVTDPSDEPVVASRIFERIFGLTPAEGRLAQQLCVGRSLYEAAESLRLTRHTARWVLKQLFTKTQTNRQAVLVQTLLRALPPLDVPSE